MGKEYEWKSRYASKVLFDEGEGYYFEMDLISSPEDKLFGSGLVDLAIILSKYEGKWDGLGTFLDFESREGIVRLKPRWNFFLVYNKINPEELLKADNPFRRELFFEKGVVVPFDKYLRVVSLPVHELLKDYGRRQ